MRNFFAPAAFGVLCLLWSGGIGLAPAGADTRIPAGAIAPQTTVRITGNPATAGFIRTAAAAAARAAAQLGPGTQIALDPESIEGVRDLPLSDVLTVNVPLQLNASDDSAYFSIVGWTRVRVENVALPHIRPKRLLVSDYPEQLRENGVLFAATLDRSAGSQRFLYYHDNPQDQPARRILLRAYNASAQPAILQFITGEAGPEPSGMEVGHLSTLRFLARVAQNEGNVVVVPPNGTTTLVDQLLPPGTVVSNLLQLRELEGESVDLTLVAQDAGESADQPYPSELLQSAVKHARGIYRVPEFSYDYAYDVGSDRPLEIPIGVLPLPNLREGEALSGDYGVLQSIALTVRNPTNSEAPIALYENPRGGSATGTYIIDRTLVQSHAAAAFSKWKLREYRVPPHGVLRISVVTMPEGGSSYPVRLIVAPDDGSASPGSPASPVY